MKSRSDLFLHEEILLLALRDRRGTIEPGTHYQFGIAGGILAELLMQKRIRIDPAQKKRLVESIKS